MGKYTKQLSVKSRITSLTLVRRANERLHFFKMANNDIVDNLIAAAAVKDWAQVRFMLSNYPLIEEKIRKLFTEAELGNQEGMVTILNEDQRYINVPDSEGMTVLMKAALSRRSLEVWMLCHRNGLDVNIQDETERTALMFASIYCSRDAVRAICEQGADVDISPRATGTTALMLAATHNRFENVQELCERGADIQTPDMGGRTALIWAAYNGRLSIVQYLCERGADIQHESIIGKTALIWAATRGFPLVAEYLCKRGTLVTRFPIPYIFNNQCRELIRRQLERCLLYTSPSPRD